MSYYQYIAIYSDAKSGTSSEGLAGGDSTCTMEECIVLDKTYRKYRKGRLVEKEDIWAIGQLCDFHLLKVYFENDEPHAVAKTRGIL